MFSSAFIKKLNNKINKSLTFNKPEYFVKKPFQELKTRRLKPKVIKRKTILFISKLVFLI